MIEFWHVLNLDGIKVRVIETPGHTFGHVCYLVDDRVLFSGDCLAVNATGGYGFFDFFTQNPELNKKSLRRLKKIMAETEAEYVCTGHSGMHKLDGNTFAHIDESAAGTRRMPFDPTAPKSIVSKHV